MVKQINKSFSKMFNAIRNEIENRTGTLDTKIDELDVQQIRMIKALTTIDEKVNKRRGGRKGGKKNKKQEPASLVTNLN